MAQTPIVVQLDSAIEQRLNALARERQQSVSDVAAEVIASYLDPESWEHRHIRAGLAELEAGRAIGDERVTEWLDSWGDENELPPPQ